MQELFDTHKPIHQYEEEERSIFWNVFLDAHNNADSSSGDSSSHDLGEKCRLLAAAIQGLQERSSEPEFQPQLQQFNALVQSGIPTALRGVAWRNFLGALRLRLTTDSLLS